MTIEPDSDPARNTDRHVWPAEIPPQPIAPWQQRRIRLPVLLFVATCLSTWITGGLAFSMALMTILLAHEMGHYLQARRYGVPATLPYFIPMPFSPIGTMGAVIAMQPGMGDRRSLFDIAVSGRLAGLVRSLILRDRPLLVGSCFRQ
jgi:Zn-dependent protease